MKNIILFILFFATIGVLANQYFIPKMEQTNTIDDLDAALQNVRAIVPKSADIYFISTKAPNEVEIRYKTQMALAPRAVVFEDFKIIPKGSYLLKIEDIQAAPAQKDTLLQLAAVLVSGRNQFAITLLKKK